MGESKFDVAALNRELLARCIQHGNFKRAFDRGIELFELQDVGMPGSGFLVFGPSGVGKTKLTKTLVSYGHKHFGPDSVMRTQLESGATIKGMLSGLLLGFGDPRSSSGTAQDLARRLLRTITARKCRLIIIDETQHLIPGGKASPALVDNILNSFKILDESGVSFVLAGMDSITNLWGADSQIRSRFQTVYHLEPLIYPRDRPTWLAIVKKYKETMEKFEVVVDCPNFEDRLYGATRGAMRPLLLILTSAIVEAHRQGKQVITGEHLRVASEKQVDDRDGCPNAFDLDLQEIVRYNNGAHTNRSLAPVQRSLQEALCR